MIRTKGGERNVEPIYGDPLKWIDAANSRAGRSCHSYVINCPVELGHDSNWIDYRYALRGETGGGDGSGGGGDGAERCRWFHSISDQIGPENQRRDWKISHGNYDRLLQLYTPKMSGTSPEIHTYTAHIGAHRIWKRVSPLFPPAILSFRSFHLFTYNQRASPTLIPIKNERNFTRYLRIMFINNFYDVMHTAPGFITTITLGLITYNKVHFHQKIWKKMLLKSGNEFLVYAIYNKYLSCKKFLMKSIRIYIVANGLINNKIIINVVNRRQRPWFLKYFPRYWNGRSLTASYLGSDTRYYARNP